MELKAYAKINLILNVLGRREDGYHEVEMLMQAISLCDVVRVEETDHLLDPRDFEYGSTDLAYMAALLMAEKYRPDLIAPALDEDGTELAAGINGVRISIEKHIPAAAGLAGGSADAAAVLIGLAKLWLADNASRNTAPKEAGSCNAAPKNNGALLKTLLPLGAKLGSDVPFCIASQLGHPAAIARGRGTELEFVQPTDCGVDLYFPDVEIPDKTRSVYAELKEEDCKERFSIEGFLKARTLAEKRRFMGNHLQAPAERLITKVQQLNYGCKHSAPEGGAARKAEIPADSMLSGAGPAYFTISENGAYRTITK